MTLRSVDPTDGDPMAGRGDVLSFQFDRFVVRLDQLFDWALPTDDVVPASQFR